MKRVLLGCTILTAFSAALQASAATPSGQSQVEVIAPLPLSPYATHHKKKPGDTDTLAQWNNLNDVTFGCAGGFSACWSGLASDAMSVPPLFNVASERLVVHTMTTTNFAPAYSSSWWSQIGLTTAIETQANGGNGIIIGDVDTGIAVSQPEVAGHISPLSGCAAVSFTCPSGVNDDNGHGTATASIAAGVAASGGMTMSGVAPNATILAEKVLNASGSGTDADVANGITAAVNGGASVINLSLTYTPTSAVINAINYAASKGVIIVFAGGNSATAFDNGANTSGLSSAALSHIVFAGSVNSSNQLSSFSDYPGSGLITTTAGTSGTASKIAGSTTEFVDGKPSKSTRPAPTPSPTPQPPPPPPPPVTGRPYASLWLDAPGENIVAPCVQYGAGSYCYWTGTSMAAPMVSGALALLEATWPILKTNSTATQLLFSTATNIGPAATYGDGLLNLTAAFNPVGPLSVLTSSTSQTPVSQLTPTTLSGGKAGSLAALKPILANYTVFDSFERNFSANLSGLLQVAHPQSASVQPSAQIRSATSQLNENTFVSFARGDDNVPAAGTSMGVNDLLSPADRVAANATANQQWSLALEETDGLSVAAGNGFPSTASFTTALWGPGPSSFTAASAQNMQTDLLGLAQGGHFLAAGTPLGERTRVAFSWSSSVGPNMAATPGYPNTSYASAVAAGVSTAVTDGWSVSLNVQTLHEEGGLLGTAYNADGSLSLGNDHRSSEVGIGSAINLSDRTQFVLNAAIASTDASDGMPGLIHNVSALMERSMSATLATRDAIVDGDGLSLSLAKPLRVFSGSMGIETAGVNPDGTPFMAIKAISAAPTGSETDLSLAYSAEPREGLRLSGSLTAASDSDNVSGQMGATVQLYARLTF